MSKLSERTMLVDFHRSSYSGSKVDQEVSEEARRGRNAERGAGRFTKVLIHPKFFGCVTAPISQAEAVWKSLSLPWDKGGARIMSSTAYPTFNAQMHAAKLTVEIGKAELLKREKDIHDEARRRLQGMYNPDEYPSIQEIADRFGIDVEFKPVPEGGDFRTKLADATVKAMVKEIEQRNQEKLEKATQDIFKRVHKVVETLTTTLKEYQPKTDTTKGRDFRNTLIHNVRAVADSLPALNIALDTRLDTLADEMIDSLTQVSGDVLKVNATERAATIAKADALLAKVESFMA